MISWRVISSGSGVVAGIAVFIFAVVLFSSVDALWRKKPTEAVLHEGDTKIVLQRVDRHREFEVVEVLHSDFNMSWTTAADIFKSLPLTLEPAVLRSQAEDIVEKLINAGAVAALVTIDQAEESP